MRRALHAEWTKARTAGGMFWLLAAAGVVTVALGALASGAVTCGGVGCGQDPARISLTGVAFGQAIVAVVAVLLVGGEYGSGMIRVTFTAVPRRLAVVAAKAVVLVGSVLVSGGAAVLASVVVGRWILPGSGFTPANGHAPLSLADEPVLRATVGSVLYLVLVGLIGLGLALAVRESSLATGLVLGLLYVFPIVISLVPDPDWHRRLQQIAPMTAGLAVQATTDGQPIGPWKGLAVLAAWALGALVVGALAVRLRDA
jgi:ABC-2 type transport system permease protein